jgi:hypothetical protein
MLLTAAKGVESDATRQTSKISKPGKPSLGINMGIELNPILTIGLYLGISSVYPLVI